MSEHNVFCHSDGQEYSPLTPASVDHTPSTGEKAKQKGKGYSKDETSLQEQPLLCSVLNTVFDHIMEEPSQLEPEEYKLAQEMKKETGKRSKLLVPVIRIFGPILRRENLPIKYHPVQSACLYIHGAFPYLLARPRIAGPDGSIHRYMGNFDQSGEWLDWDDPEQVKLALPKLQELLEEDIESRYSPADEKGAGADKESSSKRTSTRVRVVRRLSVEMGRGFFTFCQGPPAPFVRIEYYNPDDRWKVKRSLERGLSAPSFYHPDPMQYDPFGSLGKEEEQEQEEMESILEVNDTVEDDITDELLQFNCFEAHIPYSMQFFKDWNLAGMAYIHITRGLFRGRMPQGLRPHFHHKHMEGCDEERQRVPSDYLFIESNTQAMVWPDDELTEKQVSWVMCSQASVASSGVDDLNGDISQLSSESRSLNHKLMKKETTCDVELDIIVNAINNVEDVMTALPSDQIEQEQTHWRAVPSLRQIWLDERSRMAKLLPPEHDFLSGKSQRQKPLEPAFTLNVKGKDAPKSGTKLAVEGMQRLRRVSDGLEENFRRAMKEIINRYGEKVEKVDRLMSADGVSSRGYSFEKDNELTPTDNETLDALVQMSKFDESEHGFKEKNITLESVTSPTSNSMLVEEASPPGTQDSQSRSQEASQKIYSPQKLSQSNAMSDFEYSQRVERGEPIVDVDFDEIEDCIDPLTLRPRSEGELMEDSEDEEDFRDETAIEEEMDELATQTLEGNHNDSKCEVHLDDVTDIDEDSIIFSNEEERLFVDTSGDNDIMLQDDSSQDSSNVEQRYSKKVQQNTKQKLPPLRKQATSSEGVMTLLTLPPKDRHPPWMRHLDLYLLDKKRWARTRKSSRYSWFSSERMSESESTGQKVSLRRLPPLRKQVVWTKKQYRFSERSRAPDPCHKSKKKKLTVNGEDELMVSLVVDANSRKLVSVSHSKDQDDGILGGKQVEEVQWNLSQNLSQAPISSQGDKQQPKNQSKTTPDGSVLDQSSGDITSPVSIVCGSSSTPVENASALAGMGNQGGRLFVAAGGELKAKLHPSQRSELSPNLANKMFLPTPITIMAIEIFVPSRMGPAGPNDSKQIAMVPDPDKDKVSAVVFALARDPGGGDSFEYLERGIIFVPLDREMVGVNPHNKGLELKALAEKVRRAVPCKSMGISSPVSVECVLDEGSLLNRLTAKIRSRDPDMLLSWDPQSAGIGYLIKRGVNMGDELKDSKMGQPIDLAKALGRSRKKSGEDESKELVELFHGAEESNREEDQKKIRESWTGSGHGHDWDERVGAGVAANSIVGRLVFAGWKLVQEEVKHPNASYLPAIIKSVLGLRIPYHDYMNMTRMYGQDMGRERWRVFHHLLVQATANLMLFDALDVVGRAGEAARLSGVEFADSFPGIRGSQYKVEGVLLRALKSLNSNERGSKKGRKPQNTMETSESNSTQSNPQSPWKRRRNLRNERDSISYLQGSYFFYSPSKEDADRQEALEVQALTLEPKSGHYEDPVVVCDFTALYPSLVIAYNLCYSTCFGKLEYHSTRQEMRIEGKTTGKLGPFLVPEGKTATCLKHHMKSLSSSSTESDRAYASPTGTLYVSESVVKGVLPQVLDEILSTRAMLKKAAKHYKKHAQDLSPAILRQLEARQLALKYVANVTYGYTSATFSGRCAMPLLADTIVQCGRQTLKNAIDLANAWGNDRRGQWTGCRVLYGDTDSLFIRLPGRSVKEAFRFGREFCQAVTRGNPPPVELKLEKVYLGCMLQTKKKYCGMKFESPTQAKAVFEAKGLETVRRDQCALTQKILRNCLIASFTKGIASTKKYILRQWSLILSGELPVSDFILTGRVRSRYRGSGIGPVQAALARRLAEADPGRRVLQKSRVAYVIVASPGKNFRLRENVLTPNELLEQWDAFVLNTTYYITKHVNPALQRCFGLAPYRVEIESWFHSMAKPRNRIHFWPSTLTSNTGILSRFFASSICPLCGGVGQAKAGCKVAVCDECRRDELKAIDVAFQRLNLAQTKASSLAQKCTRCNLAFEDAGSYATLRSDRKKSRRRDTPSTLLAVGSTPGVYTPLAACSCIDCPVSYERHRLRELEYQAIELCRALGAGEEES